MQQGAVLRRRPKAQEAGTMEDHQDGKDAAVRHLHAGIERVRKDLMDGRVLG